MTTTATLEAPVQAIAIEQDRLASENAQVFYAAHEYQMWTRAYSEALSVANAFSKEGSTPEADAARAEEASTWDLKSRAFLKLAKLVNQFDRTFTVNGRTYEPDASGHDFFDYEAQDPTDDSRPW